MTIQLSEMGYWENRADGYLFLLEEGFEINSDLEKIENEHYPNLKNVLAKHKFEGKKGQSFVLSGDREGDLVQFVFVGLGKIKKNNYENLSSLRVAVQKIVPIMKKLELPQCVLNVPSSERIGKETSEVIKQIAIAAHMADYEFMAFKTGLVNKEDKKEEFEGTLILVAPPEEDKTVLEEYLYQGNVIGRAVNLARHWDDLPPNVLTPTTFAKAVEKVAKSHGLKCRIFGRDKAVKLGMGGFAAVDSGSDQDGQFVVVEYSAPSKDAPTIALVGKGVVFDSGGISLKPARAMTGMKFDMCGASAVFATMQAIARLKPDVNVVGFAPVVENMPSGKSCRQDDIITFMNGKTTEIVNTDAEGRLILADALCYAEKYYDPDVILDIATLTGASVVALGHFFTALLCRDEKLCEQLEKVGKLTGDRLWRLPLDDVFAPALKSDFADLSNCGTPAYSGGTITAGMFLENFVENPKWAHLDIGGTAHDVPGIKGASGVGVRLFIDYILNYK